MAKMELQINMSVEELLQKLIMREISLSQCLMLCKVKYRDSLSEASYHWICNELEHYDDPLSLPDYRILDCALKLKYTSYYFGTQIEELDTSFIIKQMNDINKPYASPNKMLVRQSIESIESSIDTTHENVQMVLPKELMEMTMKYFTYPSGCRIEQLFQECRVEQIKNIIPCVRNRLINILETEVLYSSRNHYALTNTGERKKVFISYGWDNPAHRDWVQNLAIMLSEYFEVIVDVKLPLGGDLNVFMEQMIKNADRVLLILTPKYKEKADARQNGVGYESVIISSELYKDQGTTKFIPIIRKGDVAESFPIFLGQRKGLDMTDDTLFDKSFAVLVDDIRNV